MTEPQVAVAIREQVRGITQTPTPPSISTPSPTIRPSRPPAHLRFRLRLDGGGWQIALEGELDIAGSPHLIDLIGPIASQPPRRVELDLGAITFIDLRGLRALDDFAAGCSVRGVSVTEVRPAPCVQHLRDLCCVLSDRRQTAATPATENGRNDRLARGAD